MSRLCLCAVLTCGEDLDEAGGLKKLQRIQPNYMSAFRYVGLMWEKMAHHWPSNKSIKLPVGPLTSECSLQYIVNNNITVRSPGKEEGNDLCLYMEEPPGERYGRSSVSMIPLR